MTALAEEIRVLSGTTEAIGLDAMKAHVGEANDEVASQVELLAQVVAALEGKASGSGVGASVQWHDFASLPTSYAIEEPDGFERTYYMELPSRYCWVLFRNLYEIGCYDVLNEKESYNLGHVHLGMQPSIIEESGVTYLQLTTAVVSDLYYAIVEIPPIA
jgi:hypothetical protein